MLVQTVAGGESELDVELVLARRVVRQLRLEGYGSPAEVLRVRETSDLLALAGIPKAPPMEILSLMSYAPTPPVAVKASARAMQDAECRRADGPSYMCLDSSSGA